MKESLPAVVLRIVEAITAQDLERTLEQMHPEGWFEDPTGRFAGKDELRGFFTQAFALVKDVDWEITWVAVDGERVAFEWVFAYEVRVGEASGRRTRFPGVSLMTLRDGRIHGYRDYWDPRTPLSQLGLSSFDEVVAPSASRR